MVVRRNSARQSANRSRVTCGFRLGLCLLGYLSETDWNERGVDRDETVFRKRALGAKSANDDHVTIAPVVLVSPSCSIRNGLRS